MKTVKTGMIAIGLAFGLSFGSMPVLAANQDDVESKFNMNEITCWDLGTVEEDIAGYTMMMLYGYFAGINDMAEHDGAAIQGKLMAVGAVCEENPDMTALEAFKRAAAK